MRLFLAVLVLIGLCACKPKPAADAANAEPENAWSQFPLYRKAAAASTSMRPGVWVGVDPKCPFLEAESTGVWPTCAQFMVVRPRMLITHHSGDSLELLTTQSYLMIDGYPRILQLAEGLGRTPYWFRYEGLRPLASDPDGSITRARLWNVTCGSAPANEAAPAASDSATRPSTPDCHMESQGAVRSAIIAAEDPRDQSQVYHWVRDAEH